jgi:cation diffusion facilitator family transporter
LPVVEWLAPDPHARAKRLAARVSLAGGAGALLLKLGAYLVTGSAAILSDALESTVNVAAAALLVLSIGLAARPADRSHPYGHGKAELFSAAFEGALIGAAAVLIVLEAARALWSGPQLRSLGTGGALVALASAANAALGSYVIAVGRRTGSLALVADGRHLLSDVLTSAAVLVGLFAARATGWLWLDPAIALGVAALLLRTGLGLARRAVAGLMDEADDATLARLAGALEESRAPSWVDVHSLRAWSSGDVHHVDLHLVAPRFFSADQLHVLGEELETAMLGRSGLRGEAIVHLDPCRPRHCSGCALEPCPVRRHAFAKREPLSLDRVLRSDEPIG